MAEQRSNVVIVLGVLSMVRRPVDIMATAEEMQYDQSNGPGGTDNSLYAAVALPCTPRTVDLIAGRPLRVAASRKTQGVLGVFSVPVLCLRPAMY